MSKIPDLENGPSWSEEHEPHSKSAAPNCVVELDGLTGLFLVSCQGAYYRDQHLHQQIHIAGSPRDSPYYYDEYHRQYHMRFPPKPRAYRQYYQGRHANNENRRYFQRDTLERSILSNQNDRRRRKTERRTSEDARSPAANRDYEYMTEKLAQTAGSGEKDPFLISTKDILGFCLMRDHQLIPTGDQLKEPEQVIEGKRPIFLPGSSRNEHEEKIQWARLWERILMGVCGGVALIAPMLIMVLHKTQATTLATTSVATILFALMLAVLGKNLRGQDVLAAVAAYAECWLFLWERAQLEVPDHGCKDKHDFASG
ncbi:hypothetical protein N7488_011262 [Penicillium malachiteum]|nr:hypothetical protein N7488_011262 [Penicillium malachiteum]